MKRETIVKNYIRKNILPRKSLCPIILQKWKNKNSYYYTYWNSENNKRTCNSDKVSEILNNRYQKKIDLYNDWTVSPRKIYIAFYMYYDHKNEMLELSLIHCNGNRGNDGVEKVWEYDNENRYFLFKGDFHPYKYDEETNKVVLAFSDDNGKYYNKRFIKEFLSLHHYLSQASTGQWAEYAKNTECYKDGMRFRWHIIEAYKNVTERNIKENPLIKMELKPFNFFYEKVKESGKIINNNFIVFEKINENSGVFRYFITISNNACVEKMKLFIIKNKPTVLYFNTYEFKWEVTNYLPSDFMSNYDCDWKSTESIFNFEESLSIKSINYISEILRDASSKMYNIRSNILDDIVTILRHPIIERLYKSGYKDLTRSILIDAHPIGTVKKIFNLKEEVKTIKEIKLNKHILSKFNEFCSERNSSYICPIPYSSKNLIHNLDEILGRETFNHLSEKDIKLWMSFISNYDYIPCFYEQYNNEIGVCGRYKRDNFSENDKKLLSKIKKIIENNAPTLTNNIARVYKDIHSLYFRIENRPNIDFMNAINDYNNLFNIHNNLTTLLNEENRIRRERYEEYQRIESKRQTEKFEKLFEKLQEKRKELYNYEDDKYIIRVPENLTEITEEGIALGHCVGSYISRHANGNTNIIFVRKKDKKNESFYTIEVSDGRVVQIHGKHNRWLGNDPDAIPSVYKWINERKLQCSYNILLNLGTGYAPSDKMLDRSVLNRSVLTY